MRIRAIAIATMLLVALGVTPSQATSLSAEALLERLTVASESNSSSYNRDLFRHWIDSDKDSCNTREEVLIQESISPTKRGSGCKILSGKWLSQYEKKTFTSASKLDIDHMVPLKEAWESGAFGWTAKRRESFANDLGFQGSLIAVSASTNRSKSDKDPQAWLPSNSSYKCTYVVTWMQVKYRWALTIDKSEKAAISSVLANCPTSKLFNLPKQMIKKPVLPSQVQPEEPAATTPIETQPDPRFDNCSEAIASGYGRYVRGVDPEYDWYRDGDGDGVACE
jgi:hypothetical protein